MRIGFFGNTNNYPFMLARAMKRKGVEVVFFVDKEHPLHRPEYRYDDINYPYPDWILETGTFNPGDFVLPNRKMKRVIDVLRTCDAVIVNELGPALLQRIGKPGMVLFTGSDLEYYASKESIQSEQNRLAPELNFLKRIINKKIFEKVIQNQCSGIHSAICVNYFPPGLFPNGDRLLKEIGIDESRRVFFMMTDTVDIKREPLPFNNPIRVFSATRLTWKLPLPEGCTDIDNKGADIMIRGLGQFWRRHKVPLDIRLVKKGLHVDETMALVEEEGIKEQVTWLEEMSQKAVWDEFCKADIVFEQFGSSIPGMAGLDAMATGRPVIANARPEIIEPVIGVKSPILHATTPEEIYRHIEDLVFNPGGREIIAENSRAYVEKYFSSDTVANYFLKQIASLS